MAKKIFLGILIFMALWITGLLPIAIIFGFPIALIYAIYRAVIGIMTHNAKLKSQQNNDRWNPEGRS